VSPLSFQAEQDMAEAWTVDPRTVKKTGKLGKGSSGDVHLATDVSGKSMALKTVPITLQANDVESLVNQLKELYSSRHPNVTAFYGAAYDDKANQVNILHALRVTRRHAINISFPFSSTLSSKLSVSLAAWGYGPAEWFSV
jgi:serine/threonine protein kinase